MVAASLLGGCGADAPTQPDPNYRDTTAGQGTGQERSAPENSDPAGTPDGSADAGNSDAGAGGDASPGAEGGAANGGGDSGDGAAGEAMIRDGEGTFVGQQDPHTVEIKTAEGPLSFQVDDITAKAIAELAPDDKVAFRYREKELQTDDGTTTQLWLVEIKKAQ